METLWFFIVIPIAVAGLVTLAMFRLAWFRARVKTVLGHIEFEGQALIDKSATRTREKNPQGPNDLNTPETTGPEKGADNAPQASRTEFPRMWPSSSTHEQPTSSQAAAQASLGFTSNVPDIALELHDQVSPLLLAIRAELEAAKALVDQNPDLAKIRLGAIGGLVGNVSQRIRTVLRGSATSQEFGRRAVVSLLELIERAKNEGSLTVKHDIDALADLDPAVSNALYVIAKESIANVLRHARATELLVKVEYEAKETVLRVVDNGVGFNVRTIEKRTEGWGLIAMNARAQQIGGSLSILSAEGEGTTIRVGVPKTNG